MAHSFCRTFSYSLTRLKMGCTRKLDDISRIFCNLDLFLKIKIIKTVAVINKNLIIDHTWPVLNPNPNWAVFVQSVLTADRSPRPDIYRSIELCIFLSVTKN